MMPLPRLLRPELDPRKPAWLESDRDRNDARRMLSGAQLDFHRERRRREGVWEVDVAVALVVGQRVVVRRIGVGRVL